LQFDAEGALFITGQFGMAPQKSVPATFGTIELSCEYGSSDMFLVNVDTDGGVRSATHHAKTKEIFYRRVADAAGTVYTTGRLNASGTAIVTKHNGEGTQEWKLLWGGPGDEGGNSIALDSAGNVIVMGVFSNSIYIGSYTLTTVGSCATFVAKLDNAGTVHWATKLDGSGVVAGYGIAVDASGIAVTGAFEGTLATGLGSSQSVGERDAFVAKLDSYGYVQWVFGAGGPGQDSGRSIAVDAIGDLYVTGYFSGRATFDQIELESSGDLDVFWMKLGGA